MMKCINYFFAFLLPLPIWASLPLGPIVCQQAIESTVAAWRPVGAWQSFLLGGETQLKGHRVKSTQIGRWIEVIPGDLGTGAAKLITPSQDLIVTWRSSDCQSKLRVVQKDPSQHESLIEMLKGKRAGVLYLWSPHMPPSVYGLKQAIEATKKLGISLVPVLHPDSDTTAALKVLKKNNLDLKFARTTLDAELNYLNLNQHPPSLAIFKDHQWVGKVLPGAESAKTYSEFIRYALSQAP